MKTDTIDSKGATTIDSNTINNDVKVTSKPAATKTTAAKVAAKKTTPRAKTTARTAAPKAKTTTRTTAAKAATVEVEAPAELIVNTDHTAATAVVDANKPDHAAKTVAKSLWFVGLGVYGYSYDRLMMRKTQVSEKGRQVFDALFERGEELQQDTETVLADVKQKTTQKADEAKERFSSFSSYVRPLYTLSEISNKLDVLSETLDSKTKQSA